MIRKIARKPLCAILVAGALLLGLAGCGGDEGDITSPELTLDSTLLFAENDNATGTPALRVSEISTDPELDIGGTVEAGATVEVEVNSLDPVPVTVSGVTWSFSITKTDLAEGFNTIRVVAEDVVGNQTSLAFLVEKDTTGPVVSIDQYVTPTPLDLQTIAGTTELGSSVFVSADTSATVGLISVDGTTWSCPVSSLAPGDNLFTVTAEDSLGNVGTPVSQTISNDIAATEVTINDVAPLTEAQLVISGTVPDPEIVAVTILPPVVVDPAPAADAPIYDRIAGSWQSTLTDLASGVHVVTVGVDGAIPNTAARTLVVRDLSGPAVIANDPRHGDSAVLTSDVLIVTFSEDMDLVVLESVDSPSMTLAAADGTLVDGVVVLDPDLRTATFAPTLPLAAETFYTATVSSGVTDILGNLMGTTYSWQFATAP